MSLAGFGIDPKTSIDRYNETIDAMRLAWTQEHWSYQGKYFQYEDMTVYPRPVRGEVPILHAAVSPDSFERLGRGGEKIITSPNFTPLRVMKNNFELYTRALLDTGRDPGSFERPYMQQTWCGPDEAGRREAAEAAHRYYKMVGHVLPGAQKGLAHGGNFGSEQQVIDTLHVLQEELGVTHYICWFRIPTLDRTRALKSMENFAARVIPQLRDPAPRRVAAGLN